MTKVSVFMADGMEETECVSVMDVLMRGGIGVESVSVSGSRTVTGSRGIAITADTVFERADFSDADMLFLPGGMPGVTNLMNCAGLRRLLVEFDAENKRLAAICAAPAVLGKLGLLKGKTATCYPGFEGDLEGAAYTPRGVVTDGNVTTARGLGFAVDMGLELVRVLKGKSVSDRVRDAIQHP